VFFHSQPHNWGTCAGTAIEQGATKVSFYAWADAPQANFEFIVGGIGDPILPYSDEFKASQLATLTDEPTLVEFDLSQVDYTRVLGGLAWVTTATEAGEPITLYIDSVRWE
jgi:hypothetical protein